MKTKVTSAVLASSLLLAFSFLAGCDPEDGRVVAKTGYEVPSAWDPIPVMGRTFYSHFAWSEGNRQLLKKYPDLAMFEHPWMETQIPLYMNDFQSWAKPVPPKNAWTNFPVRIHDVFATPTGVQRTKAIRDFEERWPGHPFTLAIHGARPASAMRRHYDTDRADFDAWCAEHPSFFGFCGFDEYDGVDWAMKNMTDPKLCRLRDDQYLPTSEYLFPRQRADVDYAKTRAYHFGTDRLYGLWSVSLTVGHNLGRFGLKLLQYEAEHGSTSSPWRWAGAYARGAARQFQAPFSWYSAMFTNNTRTRDGKNPEKVKPGVAIWRDSFTYWPNPEQPKRVPHLGASRSLLRRNVRYGYFIGSVHSVVECSGCSFYAFAPDGKGWDLSPYAKDYNEVCEWNRHRDRGTVYTPVAFLASMDENFHRQCCNTMPAKDEAAIPAFMFTLQPTDVPSRNIFCDPEKGREGCLWNSEFGEIADVICPDCGQSTETVTDVLKNYKAAFLIGYHDPKMTDVKAIDAYVKNGGTLFCSYDQVDDGLVSHEAAGVSFGSGVDVAGDKLLDETGREVETFHESYSLRRCKSEGAVPFLRDEFGHVVAWGNAYGRGHVITVTARRMLPDLCQALREDGWKTMQWYNFPFYDRLVRGEVYFPIIRALLRRVQDETMPIRVKGDIQWGLNRVKGLGLRSRSGEGLGQRSRSTEEESNIHCSTSNLQPSTSSSWLLWLINNKGITKFALEPEELDLTKTSTVTVDLKDLKGAKVYDITDPVKTIPIEVKGDTFSVRVKPGEDVRLSIVP